MNVLVNFLVMKVCTPIPFSNCMPVKLNSKLTQTLHYSIQRIRSTYYPAPEQMSN